MADSATGVVPPRMDWAVLRYDDLLSGAIMPIAVEPAGGGSGGPSAGSAR
jgi:hypothetical protein